MRKAEQMLYPKRYGREQSRRTRMPSYAMVAPASADLYLRESALMRRLVKRVSFEYVHSTEPLFVDGTVLISTAAPATGSLDILTSNLPMPVVGSSSALLTAKPVDLFAHLPVTCEPHRGRAYAARGECMRRGAGAEAGATTAPATAL